MSEVIMGLIGWSVTGCIAWGIIACLNESLKRHEPTDQQRR